MAGGAVSAPRPTVTDGQPVGARRKAFPERLLRVVYDAIEFPEVRKGGRPHPDDQILVLVSGVVAVLLVQLSD